MYKFKIESLSCMSCFHNIEDTLKEFDQAINARADVRIKTLSVETTWPLETIQKLIEEAGYAVDGASETRAE